MSGEIVGEPSARETMLAVIRKHGLDPERMVATTEDAHGYDEVQLSGTGKPLRMHGGVVTLWREWPTPEAGVEIRQAILDYYRSIRTIAEPKTTNRRKLIQSVMVSHRGMPAPWGASEHCYCGYEGHHERHLAEKIDEALG